MFDSGIAASTLIADLKAEVDVAIPISNRSYVDSLNSLEQLLYTEIIKEQTEGFCTATVENNKKILNFSSMIIWGTQKRPVPEDVYAVFVNGRDNKRIQLKETTLTTAKFIDRSWHKGYSPSDHTGYIEVMTKDFYGETYYLIYFIRPALKTVNASDVVGTGNVMLPVEFIDLAKAKLRADAYKIANEDALAAKWLNDYNVLLETFKEWVERRRPHFGM